MARSGWQYVLVFLSFLALALAANPTTFCKCTCFSSSTIIPLDSTADASRLAKLDETSSTLTISSRDDADSGQKRTRTCSDCNKQFCLAYHLPICKDARDEDVVTTCFQRDSTKDQSIVFLFIFATGGLLVWAAIRPWWEKWRNRGISAGGSYTAVETR